MEAQIVSEAKQLRPYHFKKGNDGHVDKRQPKSDTMILREAIVLAASWAGKGSLVRYLHGIAIKHPVAFCNLLARVVPLQVDTRAAVTVRHIITGVPRPGDDIEALLIEADATETGSREATEPTTEAAMSAGSNNVGQSTEGLQSVPQPQPEPYIDVAQLAAAIAELDTDAGDVARTDTRAGHSTTQDTTTVSEA